MLSLASSIVLCALLLWYFFGALSALVYRYLETKIQEIDPGQASNFLLAWLALPPCAALLTCYVLYSPDIAQWVVAGHCHVNSCQQHGPQSALAIFPAAVLIAWTLYRLGQCALHQWLPARRLHRQLSSAGNNCGEFVSLDSASPAAFTLGWVKPEIFISTGMQQACSTQDINCILLHEAAHRQRRDNLRLLICRLLTAPLPARWQALALDDLKMSCEKACDVRAAKTMTREGVAAALIQVARLQQSAAPAGSVAFVGNRTEQRIRALLDQPQTAMAGELVFATISATLLVVLALINPLHRVLELIP